MTKFLIIFAAVIFLFFIQQQRILSIENVNPNLLLLGLLGLAFAGLLSPGGFILLLAVSFLALSFFSGNFWPLEILLIELIALAVYFGRRWLTGNVLLDFYLSLILGQIVFYLLKPPAWPVILAETVYHLALSSPFVFILKKNEEKN